MTDIDDIKTKYDRKLKQNLGEQYGSSQAPVVSSDYATFKRENTPLQLSLYERMCAFSEKLVKVGADKKKKPEIEEAIKICHLQVTADSVTSFAFLAPLILALAMILLTYVLPFLISPEAGSLFFVLFSVILGLALIIPLQNIPFFLANNWRMKASNQMVLCVFYIVTYMRHTSNLERALSFAAEHLSPPLSLDIKKVIWNVESEKFESVKESLDDYLQTWRKYNMEFIEAMHLIESSLYESSESRRLDALDKSLKVILDETYERMLHYAHNLKGPLTALHMLGIILPILGLVILPLFVLFIEEARWYHIAMLYNLVLPVLVYYLAKNILSTRPTGYGEVEIGENNPQIQRYKNIIIPLGKSEISISPLTISILVFSVLLFIGLLPIILHLANPNWDLAVVEGQVKAIDGPTDPQATYYFLGYRYEVVEGDFTDNLVGPFGVGALILSFCVVIAFGLGFGLYYRLRTKNVIQIRERSKALEQEFASALFQLGNRLGDGLPAEIAFGKVAQVMEGTLSGRFFEHVSTNITKLGMNVEQAVFDHKRGALLYYPSDLIESSMKVLVESSRKGPLVASQALINVSEYIKQIHRVDERLKDLMADIISDMKSQVRFLTPAIAGIVVGLTSMITQIIGSLVMNLKTITQETVETGSIGAMGGILDLVSGSGIPTYQFQIIVGLYVVQITFILTVLLNGIENGSDKLSERFLAGGNLIKTSITYCIVALLVSLIFTIVAGSILSSFTMA